MLENLLTHGLEFIKNVISLFSGDIELGVDFIHLVIDIIVKLLIEFVFNILRKVVVEVLICELRLGELSKGVEIGRVLEALNVHHVGELEVRWLRGHHLAHLNVAKLVDVIVSHLVNLTDLARNLSIKLLLLRHRHEVLLS